MPRHRSRPNAAQQASRQLIQRTAEVTAETPRSRRIDLQVQPGVYRLGTPLASRGKWYDSNLVRWTDGVMRAVGGWSRAVFHQLLNGEPCRGEHAFSGREGLPYVFFGYASGFRVYREDSPGILSNPVGGLTQGNSAQWHVDNFGGDLVYVYSGRRIGYSQTSDDISANITLDSRSLSQAPTNSRGVVVTPERFIVSLGTDGDPHRIAWCSQGEPDVWNPLEDNTAGDLDLPSDGAIVAGLRANGETLIWTESDLIALRYIGPPFVYGATKVGRGGLISHRAYGNTGSTVYWMGDNSFWSYDGFTRRLPCPVADYVFGRLNPARSHLVWTTVNDEFSEVTWHYPSGNGECNSYVTYNYEYGIWYYGSLDRSGGISSPLFASPILVSGTGKLYFHEVGSNMTDDEDGAVAQVPRAETGIIDIESGKHRMYIDEIHPDDVTSNGISYSIEAYDNPTSIPTNNGPYVGNDQIDVRIDARHIRFLVEQNTPNWRYGVPRLEVRSAGEY